MTYTALLQAVRGFDEYYEVWGREDDDLTRRLEYLGVRRKALDAGSFYLHQWHPASERGRDDAGERRVERNKAHFDTTHSILRNDGSWGTTPG